jgi:hypothetical protein
MHRSKRALLALALLGMVAVLAGCSARTGGMSSEGKVWGYVSASADAQLDAKAEQPGASELQVDSVVSPGPAWLVVHLEENGKPGDRVGLLHVEKGTSEGLSVPLKNVTTDKVIVALHADKGTPNKFDFDMMKKEMSPDRPYFVDRKELARVVTVGR